MGTLSESLRVADGLHKGARAVAPDGLHAKAFAAACRALRICEVVTGAWRSLTAQEQFEDALHPWQCTEAIAEYFGNRPFAPSDEQWDEAKVERSATDDAFLRVTAGNWVFLVEVEHDADFDGERFVGSTSYHVLLEGRR